MGLFGNLFEKKVCDLCGGEIGLLGNRKLEDGNMCKNCAAKLSPWFDERRHSTVAQIREQLAYREENAVRAAAFHATRSYDGIRKLYFDDEAHTFTVTSGSSSGIAADNPDILDWSQIVGTDLIVHDSKREIFTKDREGKRISYSPKKYEYLYTFTIVIRVDHPYFDEMRYGLNSSQVVMPFDMKHDYAGFLRDARSKGQVMSQKARLVSETLGALAKQQGTPLRGPANDYDKYLDLGNEICEALEAARQAALRGCKEPEAAEETVPPVSADAPAEAPAAAPAAKVVCPYCTAETVPDENGCCEFCGSRLR